MLCAVKSHRMSNYAGSCLLKRHKINSQILHRLVACLMSYNIPCALGVSGWIWRALTHLTFMSSTEGRLCSGKFSVSFPQTNNEGRGCIQFLCILYSSLCKRHESVCEYSTNGPCTETLGCSLSPMPGLIYKFLRPERQ